MPYTGVGLLVVDDSGVQLQARTRPRRPIVVGGDARGAEFRVGCGLADLEHFYAAGQQAGVGGELAEGGPALEQHCLVIVIVARQDEEVYPGRIRDRDRSTVGMLDDHGVECGLEFMGIGIIVYSPWKIHGIGLAPTTADC